MYIKLCTFGKRVSTFLKQICSSLAGRSCSGTEHLDPLGNGMGTGRQTVEWNGDKQSDSGMEWGQVGRQWNGMWTGRQTVEWNGDR